MCLLSRNLHQITQKPASFEPFREQLASQQEHRHYCSTTYGDNATHDKGAALHSYFSLFTAKVLRCGNSEQREEKSHPPPLLYCLDVDKAS